jgi:hypothetical protein
VLSAFDDYPIHQTSRPIAHTASADANHYDRYFFNGYRWDTSLYFGLAMGLYPNRQVADASFSVVVDGREQVSVHASRRAPDDRRDANMVGPIEVQVLEPLRRHRLVVDAPEHGVRADLVATARSAAIEEPHYRQQVGVKVVFDYTRLTQFCDWEGWIDVDGQRHELLPGEAVGSRDRSWGIRPVGERVPMGAPGGDPQFFWLWAPVNFPTYSTHLDVNETADGRRWHETAVVAPVGDGPTHALRTLDYRLAWAPGHRTAAAFEADLIPWEGPARTVVLEPLYHFQMLGLGYLHPTWNHGVWKGELAVEGERWALPVSDPCSPFHVHVQTVCRARCGDDEGVGILEQLVIGPHAPTGLVGLFDGYRPA